MEDKQRLRKYYNKAVGEPFEYDFNSFYSDAEDFINDVLSRKIKVRGVRNSERNRANIEINDGKYNYLFNVIANHKFDCGMVRVNDNEFMMFIDHSFNPVVTCVTSVINEVFNDYERSRYSTARLAQSQSYEIKTT